MSFPLGQQAPAILALADGTIFRGYSIGAEGQTSGEVVFNTAMTGYQEILTDPSYSHQMVTLTYSHIGNTGVNPEDVESTRIHAAGLIVKDVQPLTSNFRTIQSLPDYLKAGNVVAIAGIDTRKLTRILREKGTQSGAIVTGTDEKAALELARSAKSLSGLDLAQEVTTKEPYEWTETQWRLGIGYGRQENPKYHVVAFDYGVKRNILRMLAERGCRVTVLPAKTTAKEALSYNPDGIFLSNGPGDPQPCTYAIEATKELIELGIPLFGICLGHQIMGLASGAKTGKLKFGHHGANHPVQDVDTGKVMITSQNHGFAVDTDSLPSNCRVTHRSLFDGTLQGFERTDKPAFCFQGHPEASPGPGDVDYLFDRFIGMMEKAKQK
ncbi:glutamine-hydrolyzing carbamoyl-phosphate synthase small subunit [Oxalobacter sp. OttesenSCG-928-P03]|nr:glutamine-hydrolyzing carbamoyl-phosphate synthase small subunit [Oxalobacter sp. OttesenSCG-928-P03]